MMALEFFAASVLWAAVAYRTALAITRPIYWRTWLAVSVGALATAATAYPFRAQIDETLATPNLTNLAGRCLLCIAVVGAQFYLAATREPEAPRRVQARFVGAGAVAAGVSCAAWVAAPIHSEELLDLAAGPRHPASVVYAVTIYLYLALFLIDLWRYARRSFQSAREQDPPAAAAIALIGASTWAGLVVLLIWTVHTTFTQLSGHRSAQLDSLAGSIFPLPLTLFACGVLALPAAAAVSHHLASRRLSQELEPLWLLVLRTHPDVQLTGRHHRIVRGLDSRWTAQRRLIEISDALEAHQVPAVGSFDELLTALREPPRRSSQSSSAKDALVRLDATPWPQPLVDLSNSIGNQLASRGARASR